MGRSTKASKFTVRMFEMEDMRALFWRPGLPTKERSAPRVLVAASTSSGGLMAAASVVALHLVLYSEVGIILDPKKG